MQSMVSLWSGIGLLAVLVLLIILVLKVRKRRRDSGVKGALKTISVDSMKDVLVPDGMGGHIHVEHLLLTGRGLLVINVKPYHGIVFASDRMDDWTVMHDGNRQTFGNAIGPLLDRGAAVKQIVKDINVQGYLLFPEGADFSKGQPKTVILPEALVSEFSRSADQDRERVMSAFQPYWEKLRAAVEPAQAA